MPSLAVAPTRGLAGAQREARTHLWCQPDATRNVGIRIRGYRVLATASIIELRWETGDGQAYTSTDCGSFQAPAALHTYQASGDYTLTVTAVWEGSYTYSGHGIAPQTVPLGRVEVDQTQAYPVIEIRSVLTPTP
jgi:hypothetical protein